MPTEFAMNRTSVRPDQSSAAAGPWVPSNRAWALSASRCVTTYGPGPSTRLTQAHFHEIGHLGRRSGLLEKVAEITGRLSARPVFQLRRLVENGHQRVTAGGNLREERLGLLVMRAEAAIAPHFHIGDMYPVRRHGIARRPRRSS